jgi:hypothetical protein
MTSRSIRTLLVSLLVAAAVSALTATANADPSQTPVVTGCPAGYDHVSVAALEATGPYPAPRVIDTAGNDNGYVCARAQPDSVRDAFCRQGFALACLFEQFGLPHYLFKDDDSPAGT